jgi:hypothetical protein
MNKTERDLLKEKQETDSARLLQQQKRSTDPTRPKTDPAPLLQQQKRSTDPTRPKTDPAPLLQQQKAREKISRPKNCSSQQDNTAERKTETKTTTFKLKLVKETNFAYIGGTKLKEIC